MISVIVPVYNMEAYVGKCIASILGQTEQELELLLVDDGSSDGSLEVCRSWAKKDSRVRVLPCEHRGVSAARNAGLDALRGEYLMFVDADDWLDHQCLEKMHACMTEGVDVVCCEFQVEKEDERVSVNYIRRDCQGMLTRDQIMHDWFGGVSYAFTVTFKLFRSNLWEKLRFQDMKNGEDSLAILEIIRSNAGFYAIGDPFYHYLQRYSGASRQMDERFYRDLLKFLLVQFEEACENYPMYREYSGNLYINTAFDLVKLLEREDRQADALAQIETMKQVFRRAKLRHPTRGQLLLCLSAGVFYRLLGLKRRLKGG